ESSCERLLTQASPYPPTLTTSRSPALTVRRLPSSIKSPLRSVVCPSTMAAPERRGNRSLDTTSSPPCTISVTVDPFSSTTPHPRPADQKYAPSPARAGLKPISAHRWSNERPE